MRRLFRAVIRLEKQSGRGIIRRILFCILNLRKMQIALGKSIFNFRDRDTSLFERKCCIVEFNDSLHREPTFLSLPKYYHSVNEVVKNFLKKVGRITRTPHTPEGRGTRDEGRDTAKRKSQGQAARGAVLRSLDFPFFPCLKVVKRSERAATPLGAPQILSTGGLPNEQVH